MKTLSVALLAISALFSITTNSAAEDCACPGKSLAESKDGGAANLGWHFGAFLVRQGGANTQPLICYRRGVENRTNETILNVRWDVAGFRRRIVPNKKSYDSCSTLPGELSTSPISGPLYYGISSDTYETTVSPPREGWTQKTSATEFTDWTPVRSVFEVALNSEGLEATIILDSYVQTSGKLTTLIYELENRGPTSVEFLLNLPAVGSMEKLPFLSSMSLKPNSRILLEANVDVPIAVQTAVVLLSSEIDKKEPFAADVVGVYAPISGKRRFSDEVLFNAVP